MPKVTGTQGGGHGNGNGNGGSHHSGSDTYRGGHR
jgi:hypothetical protein